MKKINACLVAGLILVLFLLLAEAKSRNLSEPDRNLEPLQSKKYLILAESTDYGTFKVKSEIQKKEENYIRGLQG